MPFVALFCMASIKQDMLACSLFRGGGMIRRAVRCQSTPSLRRTVRASTLPPSRAFRATPPRNALPAPFLLRMAAVFGAKRARKAFEKLPPDQKEKMRKKIRIAGGVALAAVGIGGPVYYKLHKHEAPVTGRSRYLVTLQRTK